MFETIADQGPAGVLAAMTEALAKLPAQLWRTENDGFAVIAAAMDALAVQVDCARVGLVAEAQSRGVVTASSSSGPADWLMAHSFHLEPADATRTAELARACTQPANQVLAAAVAGGTLTVRKAVTALRALCSLRLFPMENGMLRVSGQLDPEAGAVLTAALDPLTAPRPGTPTPAGKRFAGTSSDATATIATTDPATGRDLRPPDRRRAEALIQLCRRAAAAGGSEPPPKPVVVTIEHDTLKNALRGAGHTLDGTVLSPNRPQARLRRPPSSPWSWAPRANPWTSDAPNAWSPQPY